MPPQSLLTEKTKIGNGGYPEKKANTENDVQDNEWNCLERIVWMNVVWYTLLHVSAIYGLHLQLTSASWKTFVFAIIYCYLGLLGITAGVHRLWSHRSYKARIPLRIFLAFCNSTAFQNSIFEWARDHRVHHKYTETNADHVNSKRGLFFSHMGWLMCKKHPDVKRFGKKIDMSDILSDPVVFYQNKYYVPFMVISCFVLPTVIPWYFWGESLWNAYFIAVPLRYCFSLHVTWLVNSVAHIYGDRPYDKNIAPAENLFVSFLGLGEGYHNFHHTFPWDYSTSEWGWRINLTTIILDFFGKVGLAYEFRKVSPEMVKARMDRTNKDGH